MFLKSGKIHTTIRLTVVTVFVLSTTLTAALAIGLQYYFGQRMARNAAEDLYTTAATSIAMELASISRVNSNVIDLLTDNPALADPSREAAQLKIFTKVLTKNPLYYGVYLGRGDGSFFEVINLSTSEDARRILHALPTDRWLVITMRDTIEGRERYYQYLDEALQVRTSRAEKSDFDAASMPWYTSAAASGEVEFSEPYLFAQLGVPGRTFSKGIPGSDTVVGIDMTLTTISEFLGSLDLAKRSDIYLFNKAGEVSASSIEYQYAQPELPVPILELSDEEQRFVQSLPVLKVSNELNWPPLDFALGGEPRGYSIDIIRMIAAMTGIQLEFINGYSWPDLVNRFKTSELDLLHPVTLTQDNKSWGLPGKPVISMPFALLTREGVAKLQDLSELGGRSLAIGKGWSVLPLIRSQFPDIDIVEVPTSVKGIEMVLAGEVFATLDSEVILRYIVRHYFFKGLQYHSNIELGGVRLPEDLHLLVSNKQPQLRALIDRAIDAIGPEQRRYLSSAWLEYNTQEKFVRSTTVPTDTLIEIARNTELQWDLIETSIDGDDYLVYGAPAGPSENARLYLGIIAPLDSVIGPFLSKVTLSILITAGFVLLFLPLSWFFANPIVRPVRQLAVENDKVRRREYDDVVRIDSNVKELDELSESLVSMVKSIQAHELAQRKLMDAFIKLIAQAIDDKSPYTGGHCKRVPELALMLAEHASQSDLPAFESFKLETEEQWREYRVAAWLHDCGKITTPEHIVDKGSKLEGIYNRIHEVRMRFEVLWRDAEVDYWEKLVVTPEQKETLQQELKQTQQLLQEEFQFVAQCNVGGEFLDEDKQQRLQTLAKRTWQRQFDDQLGLSPVEELRQSADKAALPATEHLLADKPEHIVERTRSTNYPPEFGIDMDVPLHQYNLGELYNLSISRGTLTAEDRFKINEHMISTIKMLEGLPFPEELQNVPRYASTHHETMRGDGYPRKLKGDKLSIPERILAVADVFEALTASDRPYKKAKPVSVAIDILHKMMLDGHLDRECFELFLSEGVYLQYAQQFLTADQIDTVDVGHYLEQAKLRSLTAAS